MIACKNASTTHSVRVSSIVIGVCKLTIALEVEDLTLDIISTQVDSVSPGSEVSAAHNAEFISE